MNNYVNYLHTASMAACIVGVMLFMFGMSYGWLVLAVASFVLFMTRLFIRAKTRNATMVRQLAILMFGAVLLLGASYLMYTGRRYWVLPLLVDAVLELYISIRMDNSQE